MSDFDIKNKVVQANDLVQLSKWNLDAVPLKILKTLVSCIDTKNPPKDNTVCISKQAFTCDETEIAAEYSSVIQEKNHQNLS